MKSNGAGRVYVVLPAPEKRLELSALEFEAEAELDPTAAARAIRWNELAGDDAEVLQAAG